MAEEKYAGFEPESFVGGTGLFAGEATVKDAACVMWDYKGATPKASPAIYFQMEDDEGNLHDQYFSAGSPDTLVPSKDGSRFLLGTAEGIAKGSNAALLLTSALEAGFPKDLLKTSIKGFVGGSYLFAREKAPERAGIKKEPKKSKDGRVFEDTVLVIRKVLRLPGEGGAVSGTPGGEVAGGALEKEAAEMVNIILTLNPNGISKADLVKAVFENAGTSPNKQALVKTVFDDAFLGKGDWTYAGGMVKAK